MKAEHGPSCACAKTEDAGLRRRGGQEGQSLTLPLLSLAPRSPPFSSSYRAPPPGVYEILPSPDPSLNPQPLFFFFLSLSEWASLSYNRITFLSSRFSTMNLIPDFAPFPHELLLVSFWNTSRFQRISHAAWIL